MDEMSLFESSVVSGSKAKQKGGGGEGRAGDVPRAMRSEEVQVRDLRDGRGTREGSVQDVRAQ